MNEERMTPATRMFFIFKSAVPNLAVNQFEKRTNEKTRVIPSGVERAQRTEHSRGISQPMPARCRRIGCEIPPLRCASVGMTRIFSN
jgi:hypothetical protein